LPTFVRRDVNNELFIFFESEDMNDRALISLTSSGEFRDESGHFIYVG